MVCIAGCCLNFNFKHLPILLGLCSLPPQSMISCGCSSKDIPSVNERTCKVQIITQTVASRKRQVTISGISMSLRERRGSQERARILTWHR